VVAFDGTDEGRFSRPSLTTVHQPTQLMSEAAIDGVLQPAEQPEHRLFAMDLVVRASCGCQPAEAQRNR
jgi:LacI family transcriptional regulator, galactose operon repressor